MSQEADGLSVMFDCDNTLLDNDALKEYLAAELRAALGDDGAARFWQIYEDVRRDRDVVDLPLTAHRFAAQAAQPDAEATITQILEGVPFRRFVYPGVFAMLRHVRSFAEAGILSDGDDVFQPRKIEQAGLAAAVGGRVLIFTHKENHLAQVAARWPAEHAVMVDDKARILAALKDLLGARLTTVHVLQGHYAGEPMPPGFRPDITLQHIGELGNMPREAFEK